MIRLLLIFCLSINIFCQNSKIKIIKKYPHNVDSYTQGLFFYNGFLYESTGLKNKSKLLKSSIKDGKTIFTHKLNRIYFGEGLTNFKDKIIQLTWTSSTAFIYDLKTLKEEHSFTYQSEGWGITFDGQFLIVSNGTNILTMHSTKDFRKEYDIKVIDFGGDPIHLLNELEYVEGEIFANIYQENRIVRIDPNSGNLIEEYDFDELVKEEKKKNPNARELNGIAYNSKAKTFYITGKFWSTLYEVTLK